MHGDPQLYACTLSYYYFTILRDSGTKSCQCQGAARTSSLEDTPPPTSTSTLDDCMHRMTHRQLLLPHI